jgi:DNA-binding transcriptional MerR regulator
MSTTDAVLRIGEVARRTGTTVSTLRAWERRYELLEPDRTDGGHRLYSEQDVARVEAMQSLLDDGWSAGAAAREIRSTSPAAARLRAAPGSDGTPAEELVARLQQALGAYDTAGTNQAIDDTLLRLDVPTALEAVVFPVIRWVGEGWRDDPSAIALEHFASNALRPRLLRMVRSTEFASHRAVAASPPDEQHDLGLLGAAAVLSAANWSVRYLGARTPREALEHAARQADADVVLVASQAPEYAAAFLLDPPQLDGPLLVLGGNGFAHTDPAEVAAIGAVLHDSSLQDLPRSLERRIRARRDAVNS